MTARRPQPHGPRWPALALAVLAGCAAQGNSAAELQQGSLLPDCPSCTYIDAPLAVGATTQLDPKSTFGGTRGVSLSLRSVDAQVISVDGFELRGVAPGVTAVLAITPESRVLDFFNLTTVAADELGVVPLDANGGPRGEIEDSTELIVGDDITLRVVPRAAKQDLSGKPDATLTASSDALTVVPGVAAGEFRIVARAATSAQLTFDAVGLQRQIAVTVLP